MNRPPPSAIGYPRRLTLLSVLSLLFLATSCNPFYVIRVGWAEMGILRSRVPLTDVMTDSTVSSATRARLRLVWDARAYAVEDLGFQNVDDSYSSFARLRSDTLALVLSAAYVDRLAYRTWWFPIVGRLPYRAYFSVESAENAQNDLEREGYDTYLRPTAAFSTLGWFADPLYSTLLRRDDVDLVETVLHELGHNHLYVNGHGRFNESFATFVGYSAAIQFFCTRRPESAMTVRCQRARDRWADALDISRFVDELERRILEVYAVHAAEAEGSPGVTAELLEARQSVFDSARAEFVERVQPALRASTYSYFATEPLNNATFLARSLYYHRLPEFDRLWRGWGGTYAELLAWLRENVPRYDDPFDVLEQEPDEPASGRPGG